MIEQKITIKQQTFADNYIKYGNATEAYLKAYTNVKKEATARANGSRLLTNANVSEYIAERMEELKSERVADQQEILETLTAVLRGEVNGATLIGMGMGEQDISEDMKPSVAEKIKAAELLGKRYAMWTDKQQIVGLVPVTIVNDLDD
ncbi:terminase small subunit [Psychrobacillus psychrotolerans]|uniref:terminase small subunit n=1 Tax=Psychrobacillus psychrotolerans TaxID=126156 RepID=UPI003C71DCF8